MTGSNGATPNLNNLKVLLTGGTGTLGRALAWRVREAQLPWSLTIFSRDPVKQQQMRREYPEYRYVLGDVLGELVPAMVGHDLVIHAAAQKHIPEAERYPQQCYAVNVAGSQNVIQAALAAGVKQVLAISTDKACHPINTYGCSKLMMERLYQQMAAVFADSLKINLCRYGNVLGSTGSVIEVWQEAARRGERLKLTDPQMTRFWLTDQDAVDLILLALGEPWGTITIPELSALSMGRLLTHLYGGGAEYDIVGLRPGEKRHEMLLTPEESHFAERIEHQDGTGHIRLWPVTGKPLGRRRYRSWVSDAAPEISVERLMGMLGWQHPQAA